MGNKVKDANFRGKVESRGEVSALLSRSGDAAIVERGKPRLLVMRCPCGCNDDLLINLDERAGAAWRLYLGNTGLSLYPSYWRDTACASHFILWKNHIYWCNKWETEDGEAWSVPASTEATVLAALPANGYIKYYELAYNLDLIPWDVLQACRQLVRRGVVAMNQRPRDDEFRRL